MLWYSLNPKAEFNNQKNIGKRRKQGERWVYNTENDKVVTLTNFRGSQEVVRGAVIEYPGSQKIHNDYLVVDEKDGHADYIVIILTTQ